MDKALRQQFLAGLVFPLIYFSPSVFADCSVEFTSYQDGETLRSPSITLYGTGNADRSSGGGWGGWGRLRGSDLVQVTVNNETVFNHGGTMQFQRGISFLESLGASATLKPGLNFVKLKGVVGNECTTEDTMTLFYDQEVVLAKNKGNPNDIPDCGPTSAKGNPINIALGNKFQQETDALIDDGDFSIHFTRSYNSVDGLWRHNYSAQIKSQGNKMTVILPDGKETVFTKNNNQFQGEPSELGTLVAHNSGWRYTAANRLEYTFNAQGQLIELGNGEGVTHTLSYEGDNVSVTDGFSTLRFTQNNQQQVQSLTESGRQWTYTYDDQQRLVKVTEKAGDFTRNRQYHYEDSRFPHFLTGITDSNGNRYATWSYDDRGRAITSSHAGDMEKISITYNADGTTTVTNALGKKTTYHFATFDGVKRITHIAG
ncbi:DUF6531 domain-containing protein, partial [Zooshikella ganghwensis]|uniref:DUF6531 domain-containing protein n=1 Tax=Zooshikella ganghwensis TaxID=202772 RepID=UPI0006885D78